MPVGCQVFLPCQPFNREFALGETDDFKASDFVREIIRYLGGPNLDWALVNTGKMSQVVKEAYRSEGAYPVAADLETMRKCVPGVFGTHLGNNQIPLKHEPERVAEVVLSIASLGRVPATLARVGSNGHFYPASTLAPSHPMVVAPEPEAD